MIVSGEGDAMDQIEAVVTAIAAGAAVGSGKAAEKAVSDAYEALKDSVAKLLNRRGKSVDIIESVEADDPAAKERLRQLLSNEEASLKDEIFLKLDAYRSARDRQAATSSYDIHDNKGVAVGDHQEVTMNFKSRKKGRRQS